LGKEEEAHREWSGGLMRSKGRVGREAGLIQGGKYRNVHLISGEAIPDNGSKALKERRPRKRKSQEKKKKLHPQELPDENPSSVRPGEDS